jgi:hypothetical protein
MFSFGLKEQAIFSAPLPFIGIFLAEIVSIWAGYFCVRKFFRRGRTVTLAAWAVVVLSAAEIALPMSYLTTSVQHLKRENVLNQIEYMGTVVEPRASDQEAGKFALTYTLRFPKTAHYLTFPAYLGPENNRVFGDYDMRVHPEYYDENYVFDAGKPYSFTVAFDTGRRRFDFSREKANIDICDGKDYFMACRVIGIGLEGVAAVQTDHRSPDLREPGVPKDKGTVAP